VFGIFSNYRIKRYSQELSFSKCKSIHFIEIPAKSFPLNICLNKYVNGKINTKDSVGVLDSENGEAVTDKEKADLLNNVFYSVYTTEDRNTITNNPRHDDSVLHLLEDVQFSEDDVTQLLLQLNICKSPGPDNIHPRVLKECAKELTLPLFLLFLKSLSAGRLPAAWKKGHFTPIFKKGSRSDVGNYTPVTLTSVCCKTVEKLIRDALMCLHERLWLFV